MNSLTLVKFEAKGQNGEAEALGPEPISGDIFINLRRVCIIEYVDDLYGVEC